MTLKDKVILVTGASSGIGKAIAIACAQRGAQVLVHYRNNEQGAKDTLQEIEKHSASKICKADLTKLDDVRSLFKELKKDYPQIDAVVNNAGEATAGDFDDYEIWQSQWQNIFMNQVFVTNEFIKYSTTKDVRKIVNISSVYGDLDMGNTDFVQYSAAKAAVNSFTCNTAKKYGPTILANAIAPGYTWTPPWEGTSQEEIDACNTLTKINRFVKPKEIASMAVAILENDAITGEIIRVDGGLHLLNLR